MKFTQFLLRVVPGALALASVAVLLAILTAMWFGFIGPMYDEAYESVQPTLVPPTMDVRQAWFDSTRAAWRLLLSTSLQQVGWLPRTQSSVPKVVALTFDDGPYPLYTPWLLEVLKAQRVPATFFLIGRDAEENPELVRRIVADGHEIANHSYSHHTMVTLSEVQIAEELKKTQDLLYHICGIRTWIMRPPGGRVNEDVLNACKTLNQTIALWNDNPGDWQAYEATRIYQRIFKLVPDAPLVLLHSGRLGTIRALPSIVDEFRRRGYHFTTLSEYARSCGVTLPPAPGS